MPTNHHRQASDTGDMQASLAIRHKLASLLSLAHAISLLALNAKVSSAQLGIRGAVFSVMTQEIQTIATDLRRTVEDVRALTEAWTRQSARIASLANRQRVIANAQASSRHPTGFARGIAEANRELDDLRRLTPDMVGKLVQIVDDMERSLRVVNYVTVGILMEAERLDRSHQGQQTFTHLATEMRVASTQIRDMATFSIKQMENLEIAA